VRFSSRVHAMSQCTDGLEELLSGSCAHYPDRAPMRDSCLRSGSRATPSCVECRGTMSKRIHSYQPRVVHGLPHDPIASILGPRPIGWISSRDADGRLNLAPYSFFNIFNYRPPIVAFSSVGEKDSVRNCRAVGELNWPPKSGRHEVCYV
jgi:hypothetical protein